MPKEKLGDAIKRTRAAKNLSLEDIRQRSGSDLATSYISRIENNQTDPARLSVGKLLALSKGLGVPVGSLFDLICEPKGEGQEILAYVRELPEKRRQDLLLIARTFHENP